MNKDPKPLSEELLKAYFKSLKAELSPKHPLYKDILLPMENYFQSDFSRPHPNLNKYLPLILIFTDPRTPKLLELSLSLLQKLLSKELLRLSGPAYQIFPSSYPSTPTISKLDQTAIESLLITLISLPNMEKDELLGNNILKLLRLLFFSEATLHKDNITQYFSFLIRLYASAKKPEYLTLIKGHLASSLGLLFQRIKAQEAREEPSLISFKQPTFVIHTSFDVFFRKPIEQQQKSCQTSKQGTPSQLSSQKPHQFNSYRPVKKRERSMDYALMRTQNSLGSSPVTSAFTLGGFFNESDCKENETGGFFVKECEEKVEFIDNFPGDHREYELDREVFETVRESVSLMVDEVCLKVEGGNRFGRAVPGIEELKQGEWEIQDFSKVFNENEVPAGRFGWCIICRNTANFYCLNSRMPICSAECKKTLIDRDEKTENLLKSLNQQPEHPEVLSDFIEILRLLARIALKDTPSEPTNPDFKAKAFSLEIMASSLDFFGAFFPVYRPIVSDLRDFSSELVLKNCLSAEKTVFVISFKILLILVSHYRELLRDEIQVLSEQILLRILNSGNSSFSHRFYSLQVLNKILSNQLIILEFFLNYDCEVNRLNLVEKLFETLSKISQGKYSKEEFSTILQPSQELTLRTQALESLNIFLRNLLEYIENDEKPLENPLNLTENPMISVASSENFPEINYNLPVDSENHRFERSKALKQELSRAIVKFNNKPETGIKHIFSIGYLKSSDLKSLALFLKNTPEINKDKLGEYLAKPENSVLLLEFSALCDFADMPLEQALRSYLELFTLPGESQQVDRVLQAFSQRFYQENPTVFHSAEAVYLLSYAMMILQTDVHNPKVRVKMTLADFAKMTSKINGGEDLDFEYLTRIFQGIVEKPLAIHQSVNARGEKTEENRERLFQEETRNILEKGQKALFRLKTMRFEPRTPSLPMWTRCLQMRTPDFSMSPGNVRLLIETIWSPVFAAANVGLEHCGGALLDTEGKFRENCLNILENMTKSSAVIGNIDVRDTFLVTLIKFSNLGQPAFQRKHLDCLRRILNLSVTHGKFLGSGWKYLVELLSKLDVLLSSKSQDLLLELDPFLVDKVLVGTSEFPGDTLLLLIDLFKDRALSELNENSGVFYEETRTFSLVKVVEIADANMERVRIVWALMWNKLTELFCEAARHQNKKIGYLVVDSLKRLASRFLQNEDLLSYQREVLGTFEQVYLSLSVSQVEIKEFLITCVISLIQNFAFKLRSGWKVIVALVNLSFAENSLNLAIQASRILKLIVENPENMQVFLESPRDFLKTLYGSLNCGVDSLRSDAIDCLMKYLKFLFEFLGIQALNSPADAELSGANEGFPLGGDESRIKINLSSVLEENNGSAANELLKGSEDFGLNFFEDSVLSSPTFENRRSSVLKEQPGFREDDWFEILFNLKEKLRDPAMRVRENALEALFSIMLSFGYSFQVDFWIRVYREILRRSFEDLVRDFQATTSSNLPSGTSEANVLRFLLKKATASLARMQGLYLQDNEVYLREFLDIIGYLVGIRSEFLAKLAFGALKSAVLKSKKKLAKGYWRILVRFLTECLDSAIPRELMNKENLELAFPRSAGELLKGYGSVFAVFRPVNLNFDVKEVLTKSLDLLLIVGIIREVPVIGLADDDLEVLARGLEKAYEFCSSFNEMIYLRYCIWKNGFLQEQKQLPGLIKQEKETLGCLIAIEALAFHSKCGEDRGRAQRFLDDFIGKAIVVIGKFNGLCEREAKRRKETEGELAFGGRTRNFGNLLEFSGSKTPDSRFLGGTPKGTMDFSSSTEEFEVKVRRKGKKKVEERKGGVGEAEGIEGVMKELENSENKRKMKSLMSIVCFILNSLTEIKPADIKNIRKLVSELLGLSRNGLSHCLKCGLNESEEAVASLSEVLQKCYDYAFTRI